ncbi:sensor histidine kinase [Solibacillus sp. FSL H8-0538]|uniref:sensor histidine kinase n=1 Tax=Solibacillus sp. FSL H8-0538 TaxID=2921400 RepID=UPI0030F60218
MKKLSTKIWLLIVLFLLVTIIFMYWFTDFLYEQLYVEDTEVSMVEIGEKLQTIYKGGKVTEDLIQEIESYNAFSNINVFAVRNPRELSACVPFDIDYDTLIGVDERQLLLEGKSITKIGYEERFERQIISVILPFTDQNRLEGILYLYYPLAKISELANKEVLLLLGGALIFSLLIGFFVYKGIRRIMRPLNELQHAVEQMSKGDYGARVAVTSRDEIGTLSSAFNQMAQSIQQEDEAQKVFLATISHELRTPISYVKGYSETIQNGFIEGAERDEALQLITREANRMERLTNELLQLARTNQELDTIEFDPIVLAETIRDALSLLEYQAAVKHITFHTELDEELIVLGDEEKLKQIFINLIENAIRYSNEHSRVLIVTTQASDAAQITVQDYGIGIPEQDLPHITERFYRVNKARSRVDGGSGLGLSIVEQLIKLHNGKLVITSELEKGTCVHITLPLMEEL